MTDKAKTQEAGGSSSHEKRYPDPYGLYQQWFDASDGVRKDKVSPAELGELWRRWFEATAGLQGEGLGTESGLSESVAPLWAEMAEDLSAKMLSEETFPEDPLRYFLGWYNDTNERWSEAADELLREGEVLEAVSHFLETYARSQGELRRVSEERLKKLQVPTRSDVARVAGLVVVVENKVDRIEEAFEEFIHGDSEPATAGAVGGLEERMDRLEGKMDRILAALEKLGAGDERDLPETGRGPGTQRDANKTDTPLEGLSLGLIEAGHVGVGAQGAMEGTKTKEED